MTLTLQPQHTNTAIHVDHGEPYEVGLAIDVTTHETFCTTPIGYADKAWAETRLNELLVETLQEDRDVRFEDAQKLAAEYAHLRDAVARQVGSIDRSLTPPEARALAAALNHFADEAER